MALVCISLLEEEFVVKKEFWPSVSTPLSTGESLVLFRQLFFLDLGKFLKRYFVQYVFIS